jgi:hypothetical protein
VVDDDHGRWSLEPLWLVSLVYHGAHSMTPRRIRTGRGLALLLAAFLAVPAGTAQAYLIDANDATVLDTGRMALELQPIGYWQTVVGEPEHYLVAPSLQAYWGFAEHWDVLYLSRGWAVLDDAPDQDPYVLQEQMLALRVMLRDGSYSSGGELEGPSVTLQVGVLLPDIVAEPRWGSSVALLASQRWDEGTVHLNAWLNLTQASTLDFFGSVVYEGPPSWPARPTFELWIDVDDGDPTVSGLLGVVADVTDDFLLQGGVRMSGWEGWADLEIRLSSWIEWEVCPPAADPDADEDDA